MNEDKDFKEREHTTQQEALYILTASMYFLDCLKKTDKEKYLQYAPGVHHMCVEYSQQFEQSGGMSIRRRSTERYTFDDKRMQLANSRMSDRDKETLAHFGYDKPIGAVNTTGDNVNAFERIGLVIGTLGIDETRKTRIIFDYDPDFTHCLLQINQA